MILVVSHANDDHAIRVLGELERAGHPAVVLDTADFPSRGALRLRYGEPAARHQFVTAQGAIDLSACHAAWWRRVQPFTLDEGLDPEAVSFAYSECHEAITGLWYSIDATWMNPPAADETAHHKPFQLHVATARGLNVPRTLITNDPDEARRFIDEVGVEQTIYKTFIATEQTWRETRLLRPGELDILDTVRLAPVIFQEFVPASADIRATVVGDVVLAAEITPAPGSYELDYRMDLSGAAFAPTELPEGVVAQLLSVVRGLGLVYGAADLRRTPDGSYVFLEVNPAGEWLFVEDRTGQEISRVVASQLREFDPA